MATVQNYGMVATPALPELRQIARDNHGYVAEMVSFTNRWPNRQTDPGDCRRGEMLIAQGWDGDTLYGVVAE